VRLPLLLAELVLSTGGPCQISQDVADCCRGWGGYGLTPIQLRCPALWEGLQDRIDLLEKLRGVWLVDMLLRSCLRTPSAGMGWVLRSGILERSTPLHSNAKSKPTYHPDWSDGDHLSTSYCTTP